MAERQTREVFEKEVYKQEKVVQYFQHEAQVKEQDVKKLEKLVTQLNASVGHAKSNYE